MSNFKLIILHVRFKFLFPRNNFIKTNHCFYIINSCLHKTILIKSTFQTESQRKQGPQNQKSSAKNSLRSLKIKKPKPIPAIFTHPTSRNGFLIKF